jgi:hypothetical protein
MTDPGFVRLSDWLVRLSDWLVRLSDWLVRLSDWLVRLSDVRFWTAAKLTHLNRNSVIVFINKLTEPPVRG